ncbi:MAG: hypothetical protein ACOC57_02150 [Acidobacteriota bacterium]
MKSIKKAIFILLSFILLFSNIRGDQRDVIFKLGLELEKEAASLAQSSYEHFKGWNQAISDEEQAVLFKSEAFAASCRLFLKLAEEKSAYFKSGYVRTNLYQAYVFLTRYYNELKEEMRQVGVMPYSLRDIDDILERLEYEFSRWPSEDNLAYLHQKYIKSREDAVYMIERKGPGNYILRVFKDLESLYRFNYDMNRGKDPWKHLVQVREETLRKMEEGPVIELTFDGCLIIEQSSRPNRPVFLIEDGKKRGITSPVVLQRLGGWSRVFEVPAEVIAKYPEGEPVR